MTPASMVIVAKRAQAALDRADVSGVVVTHGTDTVEETMLMVHLLVRSDKPICFAVAMRNLTEIAQDGPLNLLNALKVASSPAACARGVMLTVNNQIHSAAFVNKIDCSNVAAFESPSLGPIGHVAFDGVRFKSSAVIEVAKELKRGERFAIEERVSLIKVFTGMDDRIMRAATEGMAGVVIEGTGAGNVPDSVVPAIEDARKRGLPVVIVSRCWRGLLSPVYGSAGGGKSLRDLGCILGMEQNAQKARIMLMVALGAKLSEEELRTVFEQTTTTL